MALCPVVRSTAAFVSPLLPPVLPHPWLSVLWFDLRLLLYLRFSPLSSPTHRSLSCGSIYGCFCISASPPCPPPPIALCPVVRSTAAFVSPLLPPVLPHPSLFV